MNFKYLNVLFIAFLVLVGIFRPNRADLSVKTHEIKDNEVENGGPNGDSQCDF